MIVVAILMISCLTGTFASVLAASLRGRPLSGVHLQLPSGYCGIKSLELANTSVGNLFQ